MVDYRQAADSDFDLTYAIKENSTKNLIDSIWGWNNEFQLDYHKKQFIPGKIKIIISNNNEVGFVTAYDSGNTIFIENILIDTRFQGKGIGTKVLTDIIAKAIQQNKNIELQVLKINERAKKLYERLNFGVFEQTDLHYKMRYKFIPGK